MSPTFALVFLFIYFHHQLLTSVMKCIFRKEIAMHEVEFLVNIRFARACSVTFEIRTRSRLEDHLIVEL